MACTSPGFMFKEKAKELKFDEEKLNRQLNVGFSGGEKKKNEILQMSMFCLFIHI